MQSSQRTQQTIARPAMAARGNRPARRRIEPLGLRFLLSFVAGRPFAELFPRPYRLRLPSADEHDCHKTALDKNAEPRRKGHLSLVRAAIRPRLFKPSSPNMGSLYQVRDWSSERSISARNSPLLHKPPGTGSQVADGIHLVIVYGRLGFV